MVVGRGGALAEPRTVRARATVVRASGRALPRSAARRRWRRSRPRCARERVGYHVRDFGSCSRRTPARLGPAVRATASARDRNRGSDGWFYKVDDRAGRQVRRRAGPFGARPAAPRRPRAVVLLRVRRGGRAAASARCASIADATPVPPGGALRVRVRGYDNERRMRRRSPGARVTLGAASAVSGRRRASRRCVPPAPARYALTRRRKPGAGARLPADRVDGDVRPATCAARLLAVLAACWRSRSAGCALGPGGRGRRGRTLTVTRDFGAQGARRARARSRSRAARP